MSEAERVRGHAPLAVIGSDFTMGMDDTDAT